MGQYRLRIIVKELDLGHVGSHTIGIGISFGKYQLF